MICATTVQIENGVSDQGSWRAERQFFMGLRDKANAESFSDVAERGMSTAYCSLGSQK
jgi:hypothetical protein